MRQFDFVGFGQDLRPNGTIPPGGLAASARDAFYQAVAASCDHYATESFEAFQKDDVAELPLDFGDSVTARLTSGSVAACVQEANEDRFNTTPGGCLFWQYETQYLDKGFELNFDPPVSALGFFATDVGEYPDGALILQLHRRQGGILEVRVPNRTDIDDGSLLFFGFIDLRNQYSQIAFRNGDRHHNEVIGIDDITAGWIP